MSGPQLCEMGAGRRLPWLASAMARRCSSAAWFRDKTRISRTRGHLREQTPDPGGAHTFGKLILLPP
eukprot:11633956-Prorocentrum_lima.AAC.1